MIRVAYELFNNKSCEELITFCYHTEPFTESIKRNYKWIDKRLFKFDKNLHDKCIKMKGKKDMKYPYTIRNYINAHPDFIKFLNKENDKLDDVQYSKLFFDAVNELKSNYSNCILDILKMHVFKPKFERLFIIGLVSSPRWSSNQFITLAIDAVKDGYISSKYYDDIMTILIAKDECVSPASLYNVEGFKKYNGIIETKCMSTNYKSTLIEIIQNNDIDIAIKYMALDKIIEEHDSYIEDAIDAICLLDEDQCRKLIDSHMDKLVNKTTFHHFCMMVLEYDIKLDYNIAKKIHDKYGMEFFNENIRHFEKMRQYCFTFGCCLTEEERNTIFKRLQTKTRRGYINDAIDRIDFTKDQKNKLQSYVLLYDLAT